MENAEMESLPAGYMNIRKKGRKRKSFRYQLRFVPRELLERTNSKSIE